MGVDISGINPIIKSPRPEEPDWESSTDEEKSAYWDAVCEWQRENRGAYFRANWWSWRPIVCLIDHASNLFNLGIDTTPLQYNDGKGIETPGECNRLADAIEYIIENNKELSEEGATIYLCLGMWCDSLDGTLISNEVQAQVSKMYPPGTIIYSPIVLPDGKIVTPTHGVDVEYVKEFIAFLRSCGGFQVY